MRVQMVVERLREQACDREQVAVACATSPAESVHALDLDGLRDPAVTVFAAREVGSCSASVR
ncbi:hypothetical protein ACL02T_24050 [Pseudonocardia sp. RS010]|uniref:hypothetical protein n=1 Tax=Pseudonocardia sp. RS010 TaxID=3385979 RepID=UPI0039A282BE